MFIVANVYLAYMKTITAHVMYKKYKEAGKYV